MIAAIRGAQAAVWQHRTDEAQALIQLAVTQPLPPRYEPFVRGYAAYIQGRVDDAAAEFRKTVALYGFSEVRTPFLEPTELFVRGVGATSDIVQKEMFTFQHHDDSLTLRPEGTASAARAYIQHTVHARQFDEGLHHGC